MKKIAVLTSTRAEYGLLFPLIKKLSNLNDMNMHVIVSGTHLLDKYGKTIDFIVADQIPIAYTIPIYDESFESNEIHVAKTVANAVEKSSIIFAKEKYDAIIVLGDRYELLGFCSAAVLCRIPIIHIHGGEITEGAIDDKIRHAITKLSSIHFAAVEKYAKRIIQLGENPQNVFVTGALGIDNVLNFELLTKEQVLDKLQIHTELPIAAVTYHPVTGEHPEKVAEEIHNVLDALIDSQVFSVITMPNSDVGGDNIMSILTKYAEKYPDKMILKKSLGQLLYLSLLKNADVMVGNSSSGILESASFSLPAVDIGIRQKGRMAPDNVLHCECDKQKIKESIKKAFSDQMRKKLADYVNPYGDGHAADRMAEIIQSIDFGNQELVCKKFFDMECI